jgi:hypothetical protein
VLAQIPVSETKTIGSLTDRQRRALAVLLAPGVPERRPDADLDARLAPAVAAV